MLKVGYSLEYLLVKTFLYNIKINLRHFESFDLILFLLDLGYDLHVCF